MHTSITRLQNVFGFFTTVAFAIAALIAASDYLQPRTPKASLSVGGVQVFVPPFHSAPRCLLHLPLVAALHKELALTLPSVKGRPNYYSTKKEEYASIKFNLDADLSSLMTWNTKSIYVSVAAEWPAPASGSSSTENITNSAIIYDTILLSPSADHLSTLASMAHLKKSAKISLLNKAKREGVAIDKSRGIFKLVDQKPKYSITAPGGKVGGLEGVRLVLRYNVQPWVGALAWEQAKTWGAWKAVDGGRSSAFKLPFVKEKRKEGGSSSR